MARRFLLLIILLISSIGVRAQPSLTDGDYWSFSAGATLSRMVSGEYVTSYQPGFSLGVSRATAISKLSPFYFESTLLFTRTGGKDSGYIGGFDEERTMHTYNLEIPLMILFRLAFSKMAALSLNFGGYISVALSGTVYGGGTSFNPYSTSKVTLRDLNGTTSNAIFQRLNAGPRMGISLLISHIALNFNYAIGMVNLFDDDYSELGYYLSSRSLSFTMSYLF